MDIRYLKSLLKLVTDTDITEFEMETDVGKIKIQRGSKAEAVSYVVSQPELVGRTIHPAASIPSPESAASASVTETVSEKNQNICSPIVGTMYRAPSPDASPYVEVGQVVEKGQILCIVEAMKLMNEIEAEFRCKIIKILKENAQPVEYGDPLFLVESL